MNRSADTRHRREVLRLDNGRYSDMLHLPHHSSTVHPRMPRKNRAAQFSPFAALTGYEAAIAETARVTQPGICLAEDAQYDLDCKQQILERKLEEHPQISITWFQPDTKKSGGTYITSEGRVKKIDSIQRIIHLTDGTQILADRIIKLEGPLFDQVSGFGDCGADEKVL